MTSELAFRIAFFVLLLALLAMRVYFAVKMHRVGGRITPDQKAVQREGGWVTFIIRLLLFFALMAFLVMYLAGVEWIFAFQFPLPAWLRWFGFILGLFSVAFWTWAQIHLDTQWSAQLQLTEDHHLVTSGPYTHIRHPLYLAMMGWSVAVSLLTANWIFVAMCVLAIAGVLWRIPKEEQMMLEAFGDEYKAYIQRTGKFFPKL
jgi:protein-S-isoprenylcysteine O-methyltransferase Ste14